VGINNNNMGKATPSSPNMARAILNRGLRATPSSPNMAKTILNRGLRVMLNSSMARVILNRVLRGMLSSSTVSHSKVINHS